MRMTPRHDGEGNECMKTHAQPAALLMKRLLASLLVAMIFVYPLPALAAQPVTTPQPIVLPQPSIDAAADFAANEALADAAPAAAAAGEGEPQPLQIDILDGEGALNNIRQRTAREPIVEVKDKNHKPVAGALVLFAIQPGGGAGPIAGPAASASFNGSGSISLYTDANGQAVGHGLVPNHHTGSYTIAVTATAGALTAFALIHQRNIRGPLAPLKGSSNTAGSGNGNTSAQGNGPGGHISHGKLIKWTLVGVAVAVAVVVIVLTRGSGSTTVTAGQGTVAAP